jgi:hypothetical protein
MCMRKLNAAAVGMALALCVCPAALAGDRPRYDVPPGYLRCPAVTAWNGFFKWASVRHTSCRRARAFLRAYARKADRGPMPRRVLGYRCRIRYWRDEEGDIYASRHRCARGAVVIRFYGMV